MEKQKLGLISDDDIVKIKDNNYVEKKEEVELHSATAGAAGGAAGSAGGAAGAAAS